MKKPELLAPVGNMEALKAAVFAGADAVYLGGKEFNARRNANNFSRTEIEEVVNYCHIFGVKVYITVNILIKDSELEEVIEYVEFLYKVGVDALIVQDLGLFYVLRKNFPLFPIHSSTQMFIHGLSGAKLLEDLGFERIVLARELTAKEIKEVVDEINAEIKIFNHGAMCICYSGQCLMSSIIGGRSGNRGCCAQPCRKPYELYEGEKLLDQGHLISPKDLNTLSFIDDLIETGAHSFKVEGRKKTGQYVYTVISAYRKLIDGYFKGEDVELKDKELKAVEQAFNRGFTTGYFLNEKQTQEKLIAKEIPKNRGVLIGEVVGYKNRNATINLYDSLSKGDGILIKGSKDDVGEKVHHFYDENGEKIYKASANRKIKLPIGKRVNRGDKVYKTFDNSIGLEISELLENKYPHKLPVNFNVILKEDSPIEVNLNCKDIIINQTGNRLVEKAIKRPLSTERIEEQFAKLGDTPYILDRISIKMDEGVTVPISEINSVRRAAISKLTEKLTKIDRPEVQVFLPEISSKKTHYSKPKLVLKLDDIKVLKEVVNSPIDKVIFGGDISLDIKTYKEAAKLCQKENKELIYAFPTVTRKNYVESIQNSINELESFGATGVLLSNYELIGLFKDTKLKMEADYKLNAFNCYSMYQLMEIGFNSAYLPLELNEKEIKYLVSHSPIDLSLLVYGNIELMITEYNLLKNTQSGKLKDKLGFEFPVRKDYWDRTHIFNSKVLSLYDEIEDIKGIREARIDITDESIEEIEYIVDGFYNALNGKKDNRVKLTTENKNITKGHFRRGVS